MKASLTVRVNKQDMKTITIQKEGVENAEGVLRKLLSP